MFSCLLGLLIPFKNNILTAPQLKILATPLADVEPSPTIAV